MRRASFMAKAEPAALEVVLPVRVGRGDHLRRKDRLDSTLNETEAAALEAIEAVGVALRQRGSHPQPLNSDACGFCDYAKPG